MDEKEDRLIEERQLSKLPHSFFYTLNDIEWTHSMTKIINLTCRCPSNEIDHRRHKAKVISKISGQSSSMARKYTACSI